MAENLKNSKYPIEDRRKLVKRYTDGLMAVYEVNWNPKTSFQVHYSTLNWLREHGYVHKIFTRITEKGFKYLIDNKFIENNVIELKKRVDTLPYKM